MNYQYYYVLRLLIEIKCHFSNREQNMQNLEILHFGQHIRRIHLIRKISKITSENMFYTKILYIKMNNRPCFLLLLSRLRRSGLIGSSSIIVISSLLFANV